MLPKRRPPTHPGVILEKDFLKPLHLTPKQLALNLGKDWSEQKVLHLIEGKETINAKMAKQLALQLHTTPHFWLRLQELHHQWHVIHKQNEKGSLKPWKKAI